MNYRRFIFAGVAAALICSFAAAQEDGGIGLTPKLEVGFGDVAEEAVISLSPGVEFEKAFGDFDVFAELDYTIALEDPDAVHTVHDEIELGYNLSFAGTSVLSFIVYNENDFQLSPELPDGMTHFGTLEPSLKFTQTLGFGDLYAQLGFPIDYLTGVKDADIGISSYLTLGWASTFGLGVELTPNLAISPDSEYAGFDILVSYETGPIYAEVEVNLPKEIDAEGITITPQVEYAFNAFTFYVNSEFGNIGVEEGDVSISPALGVKYSF
jgi:hypothetical protein